MATRIDLSDFDRGCVERARETLAEADRLDLSDDLAMSRMIGHLEVALTSLLRIFDEAEGGEQS